MRQNPYMPPQPDSGQAPVDNHPAGIWRDGALLVVRIRDHQFPPRCIKTNEPFDGEPTSFDVDWIPNHGMWLFMLGALGHAIAKSMFGKTIILRLPVSEEWLSKQRSTSMTGWVMIIGGICGLVLTTVAYVFLMALGVDETYSQWLIFLVFASPLISLAGVAYMFTRHKSVVTARKMTNDHAWIDRISADFLAPLPEWPG